MIILATISPTLKVSSSPPPQKKKGPFPVSRAFSLWWVHVSSFQAFHPSSPLVSRRLPLNLAPISRYSLILNISTNLSVSVGWKGELCGRPVFLRSGSIIRVPSCIQHSSFKNPTFELKFFWNIIQTQNVACLTVGKIAYLHWRASWRNIFKKQPLWFFSSRDPLPQVMKTPPNVHQVSWGARRWATAVWIWSIKSAGKTLRSIFWGEVYPLVN